MCAISRSQDFAPYSICTQQQPSAVTGFQAWSEALYVLRLAKFHTISCTALRGHTQVMVVVLVVHEGGFARKYYCVVGS